MYSSRMADAISSAHHRLIAAGNSHRAASDIGYNSALFATCWPKSRQRRVSVLLNNSAPNSVFFKILTCRQSIRNSWPEFYFRFWRGKLMPSALHVNRKSSHMKLSSRTKLLIGAAPMAKRSSRWLAASVMCVGLLFATEAIDRKSVV